MNNLYILGSGSLGNCYILNVNEEVLIIDAGFKYKEILKAVNYNLGGIAGALVTHQHL